MFVEIIHRRFGESGSWKQVVVGSPRVRAVRGNDSGRGCVQRSDISGKWLILKGIFSWRRCQYS